MAHIPTVGGLDIALWDLREGYRTSCSTGLLGGPIHKRIPVYGNGKCRNTSIRANAAHRQIGCKGEPKGFTAIKFNALVPIAGENHAPPWSCDGLTLAAAFRRAGKGGFPSTTLDSNDFRRTGRGYLNLPKSRQVTVSILRCTVWRSSTPAAPSDCAKPSNQRILYGLKYHLRRSTPEAWLELK